MADWSRSNRGAVTIGSGVLAALLLVVAAAIFVGIFLALPQNDHYGALILIGLLSLVFAFACYISQALSAEPVIQRAATFGFLGMGFVVLFLTIPFDSATGLPDWVTSPISRLVGLILVALLLIVVIAGALWRSRATAATSARLAQRNVWDQKPAPSAFEYPAARAIAPPPSSAGSPPNPPTGGA